MNPADPGNIQIPWTRKIPQFVTFFTDPFDSLFGPSSASRAMQKTNREKGIVIEELDTDDEGADNGPETGEKDFDKKTKKLTQQLARQHIGSLEESMTRCVLSLWINEKSQYHNNYESPSLLLAKLLSEKTVILFWFLSSCLTSMFIRKEM